MSTSEREAWMLVALFILVVAMGFAIGEIRDVQRQLERIDTHVQAPEPTPKPMGVTS